MSNRNVWKRPSCVALALSLLTVIALAQANVYDKFRNKTYSNQGYLSEEEEIKLGAQVHQQLLNPPQQGGQQEQAKPIRLVQGPLADYVNRIGQRLARDSKRPNLPWRFSVVDDDTLNAFATLGGYVYVHTGLIIQVNTEAQLASVIGHEIGHIVGRHGLENVKRAQSLGRLGVRTTITSLIAGGYLMKHSREAEREADYLGIYNIERSGYNTGSMMEMFGILAEASKGRGGSLGSILASHPPATERLENTRREIGEHLHGSDQKGAQNSTDFNRLKGLPPETKDVTPPRITILSPLVTRGQSVRLKACPTQVKGLAKDDSAIRDVTVNNARTKLDTDGNFAANVSFQPGNNRLLVTATDIHGNTAREEFMLACEDPLPSVAANPPPASTPPIVSGRYYAVLIGVQDYRHPSVNDLDYPIGDAKKVQGVLTRYYTFDFTNVQLFENPDRKTIISTFNKLAEKVKPEDHLLIFYAGHGHWDELRQQGYWLPSNAERGDYSDWISNSDLRDSIRAIRAKHTLLISDACFSGGLFVTREAFTRTPVIDEMLRLQSRTALTSGALTTVPDRSVFIRYLLEYLEKNTEPYLLVSDLFSQIRIPIINNSPKQSDGSRPTPRYGVIQEADDRGGDFVLVRRR
jgi:predicted Zn-dependent protease